MSRRAVSLALAGLLALLFVFALRQLYVLRFQAGDVYPPYSSLRADPLGTKALYDALDRLPGVTAERAYRDLQPGSAPRTVLLLGVETDRVIARDDMRLLKTLAAAGDRFVIAFLPELKAPEKLKKKKGADPEKPEKDEKDEPETVTVSSGMADELGCVLVFPEAAEKAAPPRAQAAVAGLESELPWPSLPVFAPETPDWQTLLTRGGKPVAVERAYGKGGFVLLTDAYIFSNEALREDRSPRLLARLLGDSSRIVFDETLHGIYEQPGVAGLMRRYRLEPFLALAAVLAALFIWQNLSPLVPIAPAPHTAANEVAGLDAMSGRTSLLRRSVPPAGLMAECVRLWQSSVGRRKNLALPATPKDPVEAYRTLTDHLRKRR